MNANKIACSCGCSEPHVIAKRQTADGYTVKLWSDGAITNALATYVRRGGRSVDGVRSRLAAGWRMIARVELYDWAELPTLLRECA